MVARIFRDMVEKKWVEGKFACVGLDSDYGNIPREAYRFDSDGAVDAPWTVVNFNRAIIQATADLVCCYKANSAFYEALGPRGMETLSETIAEVHRTTDVPVIVDGKRGDIGSTNVGYVSSAFGWLGADAVTVNPYLGQEALRPFLRRKDKGIFVLCRTSNPGAGEFQNLVTLGGEPLYRYIARRVAHGWNQNGNCALVVGATYPKEMAEVRELVGDLLILAPGIGRQGGSVEGTVRAGMDHNKKGLILSSSSGIIFASRDANFAQAARTATEDLHRQISKCL
jgi:orotidine-5'-phosphate decarboxylase